MNKIPKAVPGLKQVRLTSDLNMHLPHSNWALLLCAFVSRPPFCSVSSKIKLFLNKAPVSIHFLLQQEVKKLYREILRTIRRVPDETGRKELRAWARIDFQNNKHHTDELVIKMMLQHGRKSLKELQESLALSKSI